MAVFMFAVIILGVTVAMVAVHTAHHHRLYNKFMAAKDTPKNLECTLDPSMIQEGLAYFKTKKVIIAGLSRDSMDAIDTVKQNTAKIASIFADYHLLVVENDSTDGTRKAFLDWAHQNPKITVLGCGINADTCHLDVPKTVIHSRDEKRIRKMVLLRNIYQDYIVTNPDLFNDYDFTIIWDMDIIGTFYADGIASSGYLFKKQPEINALCANGLKISNLGLFTMYTYADPFAHEENGKGGQTLREASNFWMVQPISCTNENTHKVTSCFNGLTIYRKSALVGKKYELKQDEANSGDAMCEHRTVNADITGIFINPNMLFIIFRQ
jgi:hypothetical protein